MSPLALSVLLIGAPSSSPSPASDGGGEAAVKAALHASARAIDACVARHVYEKPEARGVAKVSAEYSVAGRVTSVRVDTALPAARNLRVCLRRVGRSWTLPKLQKEGKIIVTVGVFAGAKFDLSPKKSEPAPKGPPANSEEERPLGDFTFTPGGFWNSTWSAGSNTGSPEGTGESPEPGPQ